MFAPSANPNLTRTGLLVTVLCISLAGCITATPVPQLPSDAPTDFPLERYQPGPGVSILEIRSATVTLLVYRAGRLKNLGHNHVITSDQLQGLILRAKKDDRSSSYADLYLPLASLVVDDPQARAAAGIDFDSVPSAADRQGTLGNLLGPRLLQAESYPYIRVAVTLEQDNAALLQLQVKEQRLDLRIPIELQLREQTLEVRAAFTVTHAQLGLIPYSALGGAIAVADPIQVRLHLLAQTRR